MRIRPLCYAGVLGSVSEDHASRAIRRSSRGRPNAGVFFGTCLLLLLKALVLCLLCLFE